MRNVAGRRPAEEPKDGWFAVTAAMADKVYDEPSSVEAEDGEVHVEGPDGVAVSLTPGAAIETSERLFMGGVKAQGQLVDKRKRPGIAPAPPGNRSFLAQGDGVERRPPEAESGAGGGEPERDDPPARPEA